MSSDTTPSAHTAEPWTVVDDTSDGSREILGHNARVAIVIPHDQDFKNDTIAEANARLIAAAPTLLDACATMLTELRWLRDNKATEYDALVLDRAGFSDAWDKMKSAISKAS